MSFHPGTRASAEPQRHAESSSVAHALVIDKSFAEPCGDATVTAADGETAKHSLDQGSGWFRTVVSARRKPSTAIRGDAEGRAKPPERGDAPSRMGRTAPRPQPATHGGTAWLPGACRWEAGTAARMADARRPPFDATSDAHFDVLQRVAPDQVRRPFGESPKWRRGGAGPHSRAGLSWRSRVTGESRTPRRHCRRR